MRSIDIETFATAFQSETDLRGAVADLLMQLPSARDVRITHGAQEYGKDIVFRSPGALLESVVCACVVKNSKITGSVDSNQGAMTVLHQAKQCLTHPYLNSKGEEERVGRVYIISPHDCSQITMKSIEGELEHRSGQVVFVCGQDLLSLFESYLPGFLLLQSGFLSRYLTLLRSELDEDSAFAHLAFKHGILAKAKKGTSRVYVRPRFHKELSQFELVKLSPIDQSVFTIIVNHSAVQAFQLALEQRIVLIRSLGQSWEPPPKGGPLISLATVLNRLNDTVSQSWESAYSNYCGSSKTKGSRPLGQNQVGLQLKGADKFSPEAKSLLLAADSVISNFAQTIERVNAYAKQDEPTPITALQSKGFLEHGRVWDTARPAASPVRIKRRGHRLTFSEDLLVEYDGHLLITAPAGYGKTSFCKWSALHDGERFAAGESKTMPVYVPLHQLARSEITCFEEMFLRDADLRAMAQKGGQANSEYRFRLYLDGLDEIPRDRQAPLVELALGATKRYTHMQIVLTSRDHIFGPWLTQLPRVSLSELTETQVKELVTALLADKSKVSDFFTQLARVPVLQPLMRIPLMGTLVVAVFRNLTTLPEGKAELYRIFVDLLCGGWDMAKGVKRESEFGSALKLRILMRFASVLHEAKTRVGTNAPFKSVVNETAPALSGQWEALLGDMIQDGLIARNGGTFSFAHLSFQEYLTARDLADPTNKKQDQALRRYLEGDDWWGEVMAFFVAMSKRPRDMESWLGNVEQATAAQSRHLDVQEICRRAETLRGVILECSPAYERQSSIG